MLKGLSVETEKQIRINKKLIHTLVQQLKSIIEFSIDTLQINVVHSDFIHEINKEYLKHDYSTDIITFNYSGENYKLDGEIYISIEDAFSNAKKFKVSLDTELLRLIIHGILHLVGYDDMNPSAKRKMKKIENKCVDELKSIIKSKELVYDR